MTKIQKKVKEKKVSTSVRFFPQVLKSIESEAFSCNMSVSEYFEELHRQYTESVNKK